MKSVGSLYRSVDSAATVQTNFSAATMHDNPAIAMETGMVDDGTGDKVVSGAAQWPPDELALHGSRVCV